MFIFHRISKEDVGFILLKSGISLMLNTGIVFSYSIQMSRFEHDMSIDFIVSHISFFFCFFVY